jgi:hypothetical protein
LARKADADAAVGVVQVAHEVVALAGQLPHAACAPRVVQQFLDAGQRVRRALVQALGQRQRLGQRGAGGRHAVDHAQRVQPRRADALAAHQEFAHQLAGQGAAQAPGAAAVGRQRHAAVGHDEHRVVAATMKSQASASEKPAPAAAPSTAAITGLGKLRIASIQPCRPSMLCACTSRGLLRLASRRCRLPPAQKVLPAPVMTTLRTSGAVGGVQRLDAGRVDSGPSALRWSGLLMVSTMVRPWLVLLSSAGMAGFLPAAATGRWRRAGAARGWGGSAGRRTRSAC